MAKLVLAMAVKNEAVTIEKAIRSVALVCDAAVISIDSKDVQGTREAAQAACDASGLPVTWLEHVWANNFSAMRNGVLDVIEREHADCQWLLWIDGHEFLYAEHVHALKTAIEMAPEHIRLMSFSLKMLDEHGTWRDSFLQAKCWRIGAGIKYTNREMHNQVDTTHCPMETRAGYPGIWIMHERTPENANARAEQRNELLPAILEPKIDAGDDDALFHMLAHYYGHPGMTVTERAENFFRLYARLNFSTSPIMPDCLYQLRIYASQLRLAQAVELDMHETFTAMAFDECAAAEKLAWNRNEHHTQRGRIWFAIAEKNKELDAYAHALKSFELAAAYEMPVTQSFAHHSAYTWEPLASQANCLERMAGIDTANGPQLFADAWTRYNIAWGRGGACHDNITALERQMADAYTHRSARPLLVVIDRLQQFSGDIANALRQWFDVVVTKAPDPRLIGAADVIWCEWMDENLVTVSRVKRPWAKVFTRLHGYEAIEGDFADRVDWGNVDALVCVSHQLLEYLERECGAIPTRKMVISNALDCRRYSYREHKPGKDIAYLSLLNNKKNIALVVEAAKAMPDYRIHVSGRWQDPRLEEYFWTHAETTPNLIYSGWHQDVNGWLEDKDFLLNTSLWESFSFAIHEAMAKGIKPLVHRWVAVDEFIPPDLQWSTMDELRALLDGPYEPLRYRHIAERYDLPKVAVQFRDLVRDLIAETANA